MGLAPDSLMKRIQRRVKAYTVQPLGYQLKYGDLGQYLAYSCYIPGWVLEKEAIALIEVSYNLPPDPVIVEVGSFVGKSAVLLAGARKLKGSGIVHCIDPFDASGDPFSVPFYLRVAKRRSIPLEQWFAENIERIGLSPWVKAYKATGQEIGKTWTTPIDFLYLDGDQTPEGARETYELFAPYLKPGGWIALHNTADRDYDPGHDGNYRLVQEIIQEPEYTDKYRIDMTTFARKANAG
ncbi:class I SAM-dependent methyltransferase [Leptothermofonsia sichuanensis E412]|uniref:class I SAM-dependent methyltransferase n=1 Tax=Leptothermofonsia sichuanensis TaxID=2917832 RepID=UPI001CA6EB57|nr:class I SAM-dependent methyltransferase [Leptothermofonsia sichuanensis]QZZ19066.1 class I SAM-dependent methyltransferase [Leptothermofonsia sichuanensis E412]